MKTIAFVLVAELAFTGSAYLAAQVSPAVETDTETSRLIVGHPFSAIKFVHRVKVLPDGKRQFLGNELYPARIARDTEGRLMMQKGRHDDHPLPPECNHLEMLVPPPCPAWGVSVIDPVAHMVTHWVEGEIADHGAVDYPLTLARLEEAAASTSSMPEPEPDFSDEDGKVSKADLGDTDIEGIQAHGVRWTLRYVVHEDGQFIGRSRIHEIWTSEEMQLILRVIDGDPNGEETVWGLMKISLRPDAALFRPPQGYEIEHRRSDRPQWSSGDFENLKTWFGK